jgi:hypothetical protein
MAKSKRMEPARIVAELKDPKDLERLRNFVASLRPPQTLAAWVRAVVFKAAGL